MPNTSASGGPLVPATPIDDGDGLTALLQIWAAGLLGLPGANVRPRWQTNGMEPIQPPASTSWAAIGIVSQEAEGYPAWQHTPTANQQSSTPTPAFSTATQTETIELLVSCYGPSAKLLAEQLRLGCYVAQNRELLAPRGVTLLGAGAVLQIPDLVNQQWINRCDLTIRLRRVLTAAYPILDLVSATGVVNTDQGFSEAWNTP